MQYVDLRKKYLSSAISFLPYSSSLTPVELLDFMAMKADLNAAAEAGDIKSLYTLIDNDPYVLENIDRIPFVDTPLHIAASSGQIRFATEIVRLMPSFARKLNKQGLSPMHLALQNGHDSMVRRFVSIDKELVRVKGREGLTPLHFVAKRGGVDILAEFLSACPDSIQDLTVEGDTALHIAVKNHQFKALQVLVYWLQRCSFQLRESILNWKNESGDTILHVSARMNEAPAQTVQFLVENRMNLNAKNLEGSTALDIVEMPQFANVYKKNILLTDKARQGTDVPNAPTVARRLTSRITMAEKFAVMTIHSISRVITDHTTRNTLLAVAVLVATMTYQSALSPPGGVYQATDSATCLNNSTEGNQMMQGKSIMSIPQFSLFWMLNTICLLASTTVICLLLPFGIISALLVAVLIYFSFGYLYAMFLISPSDMHSKRKTVNLSVLFPTIMVVVQAMKWSFLKKYGHIFRNINIEPMPSEG